MAEHVLREPRDEDWPAVLGIANASVAAVAGAGPQDEWTENRRRFTDSPGFQRHWVAEATASRELIGYAGVEQRPDHGEGMRIFVVTPSERRESLGVALLEVALAAARAHGAKTAWLMEYATDADFIAFLERHGFDETRRLALPDGTAAVVLSMPVTSGGSRLNPPELAHPNSSTWRGRHPRE